MSELHCTSDENRFSRSQDCFCGYTQVGLTTDGFGSFHHMGRTRKAMKLAGVSQDFGQPSFPGSASSVRP